MPPRYPEREPEGPPNPFPQHGDILNGPEIVAGRIMVLPSRYVVLLDGHPIPQLPLSQFRLLRVLAERKGRTLTFDEAAAAAGLAQAGNDRPHSVNALIRALRAQLGDAGRLIRSVRGIGYILDQQPVQKARRL